MMDYGKLHDKVTESVHEDEQATIKADAKKRADEYKKLQENEDAKAAKRKVVKEAIAVGDSVEVTDKEGNITFVPGAKVTEVDTAVGADGKEHVIVKLEGQEEYYSDEDYQLVRIGAIANKETKATGLTSEDLDVQLEAHLIKKEGFEDTNEKVTAFIEVIKAKLDEANSDALKEEVEAMWTSYRSFVKQMEEARQAKNASEELIVMAKKEFEGKIPKDVNRKSDAAEKELAEKDDMAKKKEKAEKEKAEADKKKEKK